MLHGISNLFMFQVLLLTVNWSLYMEMMLKNKPIQGEVLEVLPAGSTKIWTRDAPAVAWTSEMFREIKLIWIDC